MTLPFQEYTSYHFDVIPGQLHGALDRFAQFFIEPLCKADALEREVQAVNSEFIGEQFTVVIILIPQAQRPSYRYTYFQDFHTGMLIIHEFEQYKRKSTGTLSEPAGWLPR